MQRYTLIEGCSGPALMEPDGHGDYILYSEHNQTCLDYEAKLKELQKEIIRLGEIIDDFEDQEWEQHRGW